MLESEIIRLLSYLGAIVFGPRLDENKASRESYEFSAQTFENANYQGEKNRNLRDNDRQHSDPLRFLGHFCRKQLPIDLIRPLRRNRRKGRWK